MMLKTFRITYKRFFIARTFEIEAFSRETAIKKFHYIFPHCKFISIIEVTK